MSFVLPSLEKECCLRFTVCSHVMRPRASVKRLFSKDSEMIAKNDSGYFIRLAVGTGRHVHVDVARPAFFTDSETQTPKTDCSWPQLQKALGHFVGEKVEARVSGFFLLPINNLSGSEFVKLLSVETKIASFSIKLTGGTLTLSGAPINRIRWNLRKGGKEMVFDLRSVFAGALDEAYLVDLFNTLVSSFRLFITEK